MQIKGAFLGAGVTLAVIAGGVVAATLANADEQEPVRPASLVEVMETVEPTPTPVPVEVTPEPVVTPEPPVEVVVPEPEPVIEPAPVPEPEPVVVEPEPAPADPGPVSSERLAPPPGEPVYGPPPERPAMPPVNPGAGS